MIQSNKDSIDDMTKQNGKEKRDVQERSLTGDLSSFPLLSELFGGVSNLNRGHYCFAEWRANMYQDQAHPANFDKGKDETGKKARSFTDELSELPIIGELFEEVRLDAPS